MALFNNLWGKGSGEHDKWFKNVWDKGEEYFNKTLGVEDDENIDNDSTTGNDIIKTIAFEESPASQVYAALLSNSIFQKYLSTFKVNDEHNLTFDFVVMPSGFGRSANTNVADPNNIKITINGNRNFYFNDTDINKTHFEKPADIFIAKTLIHELMHANISAKKIDYSKEEGNDKEHQYMALNFRSDIVKCLTEFATENSINISQGDIEAISWAGLTGSSAFMKMPSNIQDFYIIIANHYLVQIFLADKDDNILRDDMTKYGGNLPSGDFQFMINHIRR